MHKDSENNRKFDASYVDAAERPAACRAGKGKANFGHETLGRLVKSKAGHDKESLLVIVGVDDEEHVLIADGKLRTIEKPKRKKIRHLAVLSQCSKELNAKLISNSPIQNAELRDFIAKATAEATKE